MGILLSIVLAIGMLEQSNECGDGETLQESAPSSEVSTVFGAYAQTLVWDSPPEGETVRGWKVYARLVSSEPPVATLLVPSSALSGLNVTYPLDRAAFQSGPTYYFRVAAYNCAAVGSALLPVSAPRLRKGE